MELFKRMLVVGLICLTLPGAGVMPVLAQEGRENAGRARQVNEAVAEATIILNEQFLNAFLDAMFTHLRSPSFPLSIVQLNTRQSQTVLSAHAATNEPAQCESQIVLEREKMGVRTAVRFEDGRIVAPLAFSGSYNAGLFGCLAFEGWANSIVTLEYDRSRRAILARVRVQDVQLNGLPVLANNIVISLVQNSIDKRFNPYELFRAEQLSPVVQIKAAGGSLRMRAREMRPEIIPGALRIRITYDFERAE